jgi:hypothetical protein
MNSNKATLPTIPKDLDYGGSVSSVNQKPSSRTSSDLDKKTEESKQYKLNKFTRASTPAATNTSLDESVKYITPKIRKQLQRQAISESCVTEQGALILERNELVEKEFFGDGISKSENNRLKYIDWLLDRIDDAKCGDYLDEMESKVASNIELSNQLKSFVDEIKKVYPKPSKHKRGKK